MLITTKDGRVFKDAQEMWSAGGKARAANLSKSRRSEIAKQAAISRWKNKLNKSKKMLASKDGI